MKKYSPIVFHVLIPTLVFASGCASTHAERKLEEKLSQESFAKTWSELRQRVHQSLDQSSHLTGEQKQRLKALHEKSREASEKISIESIRLRTALMEDLISAQYDAQEIDLILQRIKVLEAQRISALFETVDQTNSLLGRNPASQFPNEIHSTPHLSKQD